MNNKVSRTAIARAVTAKLIAEPSRSSYWMQATAAFLVENGMVDDADLLINDIAHELFEQSGQLSVEVTSAQELSQAAHDELLRYLKAKTKADKVNVHETIDPELVGGLVARTPDAELDASVRTQLKNLTAIV